MFTGAPEARVLNTDPNYTFTDHSLQCLGPDSLATECNPEENTNKSMCK